MSTSRVFPFAHFRVSLLLVGLCCGAISSLPLIAQTTYYWDHNGFGSGLGGSGTWSTSHATWNNAGDPFVTWSNSAPTDHAFFQNTAGTVTLGSDITVRSISFISDGYSVVGSDTLTFDGGTGIINSSTGSQTISAIIAGDDGLTKTGSGHLTLSGANTYTGATNVSAGTLTLASNTALGSTANGTSVASGGTLVFTNNITVGAEAIASTGLVKNVSGTNSYAGVLSGTGALTVSAGQLTLSGANTYTGGTTISAGTLSLTNTYTSPTFDIASGATLEINGGSSTNTHFSGAGTLATTGTTAWGVSAATFALGSGSLIDVQVGTFVGGSSANEVWTNNLSSLNVASGATFDTVEANVRVDALTGSGTIKTGHSHASYANLTIGVDNGSGTFAGILANSSTTGNVVKTGTGTQILSGTNTYTGSTQIEAGTLQIASGGSLSHPSSLLYVGRNSGDNGTLQIDAGGTVSSGRVEVGQNSGSIGAAAISGTLDAADLYVGRVGHGTLTIGNDGIVNVNSGVNRTNLASNSGGSGTLNITGSTAAGVLNSDFVTGGSGTATLNFNHTDTDYHFTTTGAADGTAVPITGSTTVNHLGTGQTSLSGVNTYAATTTIKAGTLNVANGGSITHTGHDTYIGFDSGDNGTLSIASGGLVSDRFGVIGANAGSTGTANIAGTWTHANAAGLYVGSGGAGTLNLNEGGVVNVNGGSGTTTLASAAGSTGTLNLNGSTTVGILNTATIHGGAGSATLNFNHTAPDYHFNQTGASGGTAIAITGSTAVGHTGTGTTTLSDAFTYNGGTTVSQGNLNIASTGSITHHAAPTYVGRNTGDNGALNIADGGSVSNFRGLIGSGTGSTGTATVSGTWNNADILHLGSSGTGILNIADGGAVNVSSGSGSTTLGVNAGGIGTLNITGNAQAGVLNTASVASGLGTATVNFNHADSSYYFTKTGDQYGAFIPISGTTTVNHLGTGTTNFNGAHTYNGGTTVSHGTLSLVNGGSISHGSANTTIGQNSGDNGTLYIASGGSLTDLSATLGESSGSIGKANISGTWTNPNHIYVGGAGTGTLNLSSGGVISDRVGWLGNNAGGSGTANISGTWNNSQLLVVGRSGTGTLNLNDSGVVSVFSGGAGATLADLAGSSGTLNIKGGTTAGILNASFVHGGSGTATLNFNHSDSGYHFSTNGESSGTAVPITGSTTVNQTGSGHTVLRASNTHTGGTNISAGHLVLFHATDTLPDTGTVTLTGGTLDVGNNSDTIGALTLTSGSITGTTGVLSPSSIAVQSGTISAKLGGSAALTKTGNGTVTLSGANTFSQHTNISAGTLIIASGGSITRSGFGTYVGINNGDTGSLQIAQGATVSERFGHVGFNYNANSSADIAGTWSHNNNFFVGAYGTGLLTIQSTGTVTTPQGHLGFNPSGIGTANVSGLWDNQTLATIGREGTGTLNLQNGGTVRVNSGNSALTVAELAGSTGTVNLNGSTTPGVIDAASVHGGAGTATLNFNHTAADYHFTTTGAAGGTAVAITGSTAVNHLGSGTTTLSGAHTYTGGTIIRDGTLAIASTGSLSHSSAEMIAARYSGDSSTLNIANGGSVSNHRGFLGYAAGSTGTADVSGTWTNASHLYVGHFGTGTLTVQSGGLTANAAGYLGIYENSQGTANIAGTWTNNSTLYAGSAGTGTLNLNNGGTVNVSSGSGSTQLANSATGSGTLNITGSTAPGILNSASVHGGSGTATLNFNHTNSGYHFTTTGASGGTAIAITGSTAVNQLGSGTTTLRGANTYTGGTLISSGRIVGDSTSLQGNITNNAVIAFDQNTDGNFAGSLSGSGYLIKSGTGTLTLTGANSYTGETIITDTGTLAISATGSLTGNTSNIVVGSGSSSDAVFSIASGGSASTYGANFGSTTGSQGTADISGTWTNTGTLQVGNNGTGILNIQSGGIVSDTTGYLGSSANGHGTANISGTWNHSDYLVVGGTGNGVLNLNNGGLVNANSGSAFTILASGGQSGTVNILGDTAAGVLNTSLLTTSNANSIGTLNFNHTDSSHYFTSNGASDGTATDITGRTSVNHLGSGTTVLTGANTYSGGTTVSAGTLQGNTASLQRDITNNAALAFDQTTAGTYGDVISGSGSVTKLGASALTLSTTQTYSGGTVISAGTLNLGHATDTLLDAGAVTVNGGTLALGAHSETVGALTLAGGSITGSGGVLTPASIGVQSGSVSAILSGSGALTKTTAGTVTLSGANTYSGGTTISAGTLQGTTTSLQGNITNNGTLAFDQNTTATFSPVISGSGSVTKLGTGALTLSGTNTYTGDTNITNGTIAVSGSAALGTGTLNLNGAELQAAGGAATLANAVELNANTTISGSDALTVNGDATLSGFNSLNITNSAQTTFNGAIGESSYSVLIKQGSGELQLTGANTYTGGTSIADGTIRINNSTGSAFGTGAVTIGSGATLTGAGSFTGALQLNGIFAPGNSPGLAEIGSGSSLTGTTQFELGGTLRATDTMDGSGYYDAINVLGAGALTVGGTLEVIAFENFAPSPGDTFQLFSATSIGGTFAHINLTGFADGLSFNTSNLYSAGTISVSAVPEPATAGVLLGLLALGFTATRRARREVTGSK